MTPPPDASAGPAPGLSPTRPAEGPLPALRALIAAGTITADPAQVMAAEGVPINDMHAFALPLLDMAKPAAQGVGPFFFDRKPLHPPIVEILRTQLNLK